MAQVRFNFEKTNFDYSMKNIGVPTKMEYQMSLIHQVRSFVDRVRWKAFHILNPTNREKKETFGFNTIASSPKVEALEVFEEKMMNLVKDIEFQRKGNKLQDKLKEDQRKINQEKRLIIPADKTRNFYYTEPEQYETLLKRSIEKECKKGQNDLLSTFDKEDKKCAEDLQIIDRRIHKTQKQGAMITYKDHKDNFENNVQTRLINPTRSEIGKVAKKFLDNIIDQVRSKSGVNLWKNSQAAVQWYRRIQNKDKHRFIQLDVCAYYPSISKANLIDALNYERQFTPITEEQQKIIIQSCRAVLVNEDQVWVKKGDPAQEKFAVTIGSYCGAECAEIVTCHLLSQVVEASLLPKEKVAGFRDDFLFVTDGTPRQNDILKNKLCALFTRIVDFLYIKFDLTREIFQPYKKPMMKFRT